MDSLSQYLGVCPVTVWAGGPGPVPGGLSLAEAERGVEIGTERERLPRLIFTEA